MAFIAANLKKTTPSQLQDIQERYTYQSTDSFDEILAEGYFLGAFDCSSCFVVVDVTAGVGWFSIVVDSNTGSAASGGGEYGSSIIKAQTLADAVALAPLVPINTVIQTVEYNSGTAIGGNTYQVLDAGSSGARPAEDGGSVFHVGSAGLYIKTIFLGSKIDVHSFGAIAGFASDSAAAITAADLYAATNSKTLVINGNLRTNSPVNFTAKAIEANCIIQRTLANEHAISFATTVKNVTGDIYTYFDTKPSTQTLACGFLFKSVIHASFACRLRCEKVYSGFKNDKDDPALGTSWGNCFNVMQCRDFVTKAYDWDNNGAGANTSNFCASAYINGKSFNSDTLNDVSAPILEFNNSDGFVFGTLNIEWCKLLTAGAFIKSVNETSIIIDSLHFEGNEVIRSGDSFIFQASATGANANFNIANLHMNNITQNTGRLFLAGALSTPIGQVKIESIGGTVSSNSFSDFRAILTTSTADFTVDFGKAKNYSSYLTSLSAGSVRTNYEPSLFIGNEQFNVNVTVSNYASATLDAKKGPRVKYTGTFPVSITNITAAQLYPAENNRRIEFVNNASGSQIASGGNIDLNGRTSPVTWASGNTKAIFEYDFERSKAVLIGVV